MSAIGDWSAHSRHARTLTFSYIEPSENCNDACHISLSLSLCAMPRRPHNIYKRTYTIVVYQKTKNKKNVGENS